MPCNHPQPIREPLTEYSRSSPATGALGAATSCLFASTHLSLDVEIDSPSSSGVTASACGGTTSRWKARDRNNGRRGGTRRRGTRDLGHVLLEPVDEASKQPSSEPWYKWSVKKKKTVCLLNRPHNWKVRERSPQTTSRQTTTRTLECQTCSCGYIHPCTCCAALSCYCSAHCCNLAARQHVKVVAQEEMIAKVHDEDAIITYP